MSLITRCPACGTMFKVVADQLKVSQGWVRCGRCVEVFDASQNLQAIRPPAETTQPENRPAVVVAPPPFVPPPAPAPAPAAQAVVSAAATAPLVPPAAANRVEPFVESRPALAVPTPTAASPADAAESATTPDRSPGASFADRASHAGQRDTAAAGTPHEPDHSDFDPLAWRQKLSALPEQGGEFQSSRSFLSADEVTEPIWEKPVAADDEDIDSGFDESAADKPATDMADMAMTEGEDVSFVRDARRKAFWRKPAVRIVLGFTSFLLAVLLVLQVIVQQRDTLAAFEPRLKPWLQTLCEPLHCQISPLRQIEALVIDSSSFNKLGTDAYRLSFSIKNTSNVAVALPAMEVTLTDTQDQVLVRRVLMPSQFGVTGTVLPAGSDVTGLVALQVVSPAQPAAANTAPAAEIHVAGYRVLAFYP